MPQINEVLDAFKNWKSDPRHGEIYVITDKDREIASLAISFSESELRHATVMRAAFNRAQPKTPPLVSIPQPPNKVA